MADFHNKYLLCCESPPHVQTWVYRPLVAFTWVPDGFRLLFFVQCSNLSLAKVFCGLVERNIYC